jgi:hypothetical protein
LGENQLEVLPETIGNLKSLNTLGLIRNKLSTLPESFKNLTSLTSLFLERNKIIELPKAVFELKSLQTLKWHDLPSEVLLGEIKEVISSRDSDRKPVSLRTTLISELKETIPSHKNGSYLEKPDEEELRAREIEKKRRKEELIKVEKSLKKNQQVKFLVDINELADIKRYAQLSHQTQSEFIRSAIWEKIRLFQSESENESLEKHKEIPENKLSLDELKKIRMILERLEKKEK